MHTGIGTRPLDPEKDNCGIEDSKKWRDMDSKRETKSPDIYQESRNPEDNHIYYITLCHNLTLINRVHIGSY